MKHYDLIVIGAGGGTKLISPSARLGLKVACVEKDALGGTCLNRGCIPSKMLIHPADVALAVREAGKFELDHDQDLRVRFSDLICRISETVDRDSAGIAEGYRRNPNIDVFPGQGRFVADKVVRVNGEDITAEKIFIAVGSRPFIPPIEGLDGTPFMTSTQALRNTRLPQRMIVIGAGYIAVELGHAYGALGTEVHFLVRSRFLRHEDSQVSEEFTRVFSRYHQVHAGAVPVRVEYVQNEFIVTFRTPDGNVRHLTADALLVAAGVTPNTDTLELGRTGIAVKPDGLLQVDDRLETTVKGVYGLGDCVGNYFFRHSVNFEGEYLFRTKVHTPSDEPIRYPPVPHAVFSHPQVAAVGKTEDELKADGIDYVAGINPYIKSGMGMALLADYGFAKILIERSSRRILGAHIIGHEASNMIHMLIALMSKDGTLDDLLNMIYIHPALAEIVRNAARRAMAELWKG